MAKCNHCMPNTAAISEVRKDALLEAAKLLHQVNIPKPAEGGPTWGFEELMTTACYLLKIGEDEEDE